jgi:hypothetical protein
MKIIIELPELDALNEAQAELDQIDRELSELVNAIAAGSQAPQGKPFIGQFQQLLNRAATAANNAPPDDTAVYIERYTEAMVKETASNWFNPFQRDLTNRIKALQSKVTRAAPNHDLQATRWRNVLYERIGQDATAQLLDSIREQVQQQLNAHVEPEQS